MSDQTNEPRPEDAGAVPPPPPPPPGAYGTTPGYQAPQAPQAGYQGAPSGYQPMAPPPMQTTGGPGQPADLGPRFVARLLDYILLAIVNGIISAVLLTGMVAGSATGFDMWTGGGSYAYTAVSSVISAAIALAYFAFLESSRGQTVGKMLLKLETRGPSGGRPTMEQALKRNAFTAIGVIGVIPLLGALSGLASLVAVIVIAVTINNDRVGRRGWHDNFAGGTTVVKLG